MLRVCTVASLPRPLACTQTRTYAGHSKWSSIKRKKAVVDSKRGKVFSKLSSSITAAVRDGGADDGNLRLQGVLLAAKAANIPKDNVERAIAKGLGEDGKPLTEDVYYGQVEGVAFAVEVLTDSPNRAVKRIKHVLSKNGGSFTAGSNAWIFERKGWFEYEVVGVPEASTTTESAPEPQSDAAPTPAPSEELVLEAMMCAEEHGAQDSDYDADSRSLNIVCDVGDFAAVRGALGAPELGLVALRAELVYQPSVTVPVTEPEAAEAVSKTIEELEDEDDVSRVFHNAELADEA